MMIQRAVQLLSGANHQWTSSSFDLRNSAPSQVLNLNRIEHVSMQCTLSGSLVTGALSFQVSDDEGANFERSGFKQTVATASIGTWSDIASTVTNVSHSVGGELRTYLFNLPTLGHRWGRMNWTKQTNSTGSLSGTVMLKG